MNLALITLVLACTVRAAPRFEPITVYYHEAYGIAEASRIKAEETRGLDARIVGGSMARLGQHPYFAGLLITLFSGATSVCGASLVSNTKVVTAAQCWFDGQNLASHLTVVLGSTQLFSGGVRLITSAVEVHGNYNFLTLANNVAMVTIDWIPYTENINAISVAHGANLFVGQNVTASGFGRTADDAPITQSQALHHVTMPVLTNVECQRTFGSLVLSSTLCTDTAGGRSTCPGDTGGPLELDNTLVGIASFVAAAGCSRGLPAGFSRATSFATWIHMRL